MIYAQIVILASNQKNTVKSRLSLCFV